VPEDKPKFRLADAEDIAGMTTAFTLPGRLAKQLAERQRRIDQRRAKGLSELSVERREDTGIDKPWHIPIQTCHWFRIKPATLKWECFSRDNFTLPRVSPNQASRLSTLTGARGSTQNAYKGGFWKTFRELSTALREQQKQLNP